MFYFSDAAGSKISVKVFPTATGYLPYYHMRGKAFFLPNYKEDELELLFCDILPDHGDKNIFSWSTERSHLYCFADLFGCHFCRLLQICNVSIYRQTQSPNQLLKHNFPTTHYQKSDRKPVKSLYKTQTCSTFLSLQH